jgi:hypothetical protein
MTVDDTDTTSHALWLRIVRLLLGGHTEESAIDWLGRLLPAQPPVDAVAQPEPQGVATTDTPEVSQEDAPSERQVQAIEADAGIHDIPAASTAPPSARKRLKALDRMAVDAGVSDATFRETFVAWRNPKS